MAKKSRSTNKHASKARPSPVSDSGVIAAAPAPEKKSVGNQPAQPTNWYEAIEKGDRAAATRLIGEEVLKIITGAQMPEYEVLFLFDENDDISNYHSDRLYSAASAIDPSKNILLVLHSRGGNIEPAYLISKTLKRLAAQRFVVAVPRRAKSAATLICLGADEIHMGMISQLGPIDPQSGGLPVLAVANALEAIAELAGRFPLASEMLTKYLTDQIPIRVLGYYQRVAESAVQYAERLLANRALARNMLPAAVAKHLVNHYKDHGFVIDFDEATSLLGSDIVKMGAPEYHLADDIYRFLSLVQRVCDVHKKYFWLVGNASDGFFVTDRAQRS